MHCRTSVCLAIALSLIPCASAHAFQGACNAWDPQFAVPGPNIQFESFVVFDDGTGAALYAGGSFTAIGTQSIHGVARWDGTQWSALGSGLSGVRALTVFDDGSGAKLYAGGSFNTSTGAPANAVARWNGTTWSALAGAGPMSSTDIVESLAAYDDGSGPALYVTGRLTHTSGAVHALRWNAAGWSSVDSGLPSTVLPSSFCVFDAGAGPKLYLGSRRSSESVFRWNGTTWTNVSPPTPGSMVNAMATYASAGGTRLYAVGNFPLAGSWNGIMRFDGTTWSPVGSGLTVDPITGYPPEVAGQALVVHDAGNGSRLYASGLFDMAGGAPSFRLASWDGAAWHPVLPEQGPYALPGKSALASFDDGGGQALFLSTAFSRVGHTVALNAARWRNGSWSRLATGNGLSGPVDNMLAFDDGSGLSVFASGYFDTAGTQLSDKVARFDGTAWHSLGTNTDGAVYGLVEFDSGSGPRLHAFGSFTHIGGTPAMNIARWNGSQWQALGSGTDDIVYAAAVFDVGTGPALYIGGQFSTAGGVAASNLARWDGTSWSQVGGGTNQQVRGLYGYDDGTGPALYLCGLFTTAGGVPAQRLARWNGTSFGPVGTQNLGPGSLTGFQAFDDGTGPELYLSGTCNIPGTGLTNLMRWNGTIWTAVPTPGPEQIGLLGVFDAGSGRRLWAVTDVQSGPWHYWLWDGAQWTTLPGDFDNYNGPVAAADFEHDGAPDLYLGGLFQSVDGVAASYMTRLVVCGTQGTIACAGDGTAAACPCGNFGAIGHGCSNSLNASGASLTSTGLASVGNDTLALTGSGMPDSAALYIQGTTQSGGGSGVVFGDGLRCAAGSVVRLGQRMNVGGISQVPSSGGPKLSVTGMSTAGSVRTYQVWYRNAASFCTASTFNLSNGLSITWTM